MFTGIVTHQASIVSIDTGVFTLSIPANYPMLHQGQSIAHDGACMTVLNITEKTYSFFAMQESLQKTNFSSKVVGDLMNIEFCVAAGSPLDGHIVTGHIDTRGTVIATEIALDGSKKLVFAYDTMRDDYIIPKGSITVNGVSLTVVDVAPGSCSVWLIPLTQTITNLGGLDTGSLVNIEFDTMAKYILAYVKRLGLEKQYSK